RLLIYKENSTNCYFSIYLFGWETLVNKYITFKNNINTPTFCSSTATRIPMRYYGFNISWRFGELKAQVKKAARSINNDDLKSGGGNAGTGGGIPAN
ncbi:hypothetical protein, partial [Phocaeicola vulgatus]|uniref:hypothetical protein n=1 Tax=Phocaeicola vulgatus TaxID=821 RepID=UPI0032197BCA